MASHKTPLVQRQWLNLIIWAMAFMILLFIVAGQIIEKNLRSPEILMPFAQIHRIHFEFWRVEQSENGLWQQSPVLLTESQLVDLIDHWRSWKPVTVINAPSFDQTFEFSITITTADNQLQKHSLLLVFAPNLAIVDRNSNQMMILSDAQFNAMFPEVVLKHFEHDVNTGRQP